MSPSVHPGASRSLAGRRVLVTGASGIVGRVLVPDLLELGAEVVAASLTPFRDYADWRSTGRFTALDRDLRCEPLPPDLLETITDCVHLAATLFPVRSLAFFHDNITITKALAAALASHSRDLGRYVHVSSLAARGPGVSSDYAHPQREARAVSHYGQSKLAGEMVARSLLPPEVPLTFLRPGIVLSRADHRLMTTVKGLRFTPSAILGRMPHAISAIFVGDLSGAIVAALTTTPAPDGVFDICHPDPIRLHDFAGRGGRIDPEARLASGWLLKAMAALSGLASLVSRREPLLTFDKLREMQEPSWCGDSSAFTSATGWKAVTDPLGFLKACRT